ncbi:winged helix-turn-helix transcriptional regulator [Kitasatospora sp. NPDC127116]|uniref:winged helix-turn-helix transcriptional regulator n=1 Tax=Kitasatospora sp. NPDC127116 TaxID=3345367 RepID=UPI00362CFB27
MPAIDTATVYTRAQQAAEALAARWATRVVRAVPRTGSARPAEVLSAAPVIPSATLYWVSSVLVEAGVLVKVPVAGRSRYGLALTDAGRALTPVYDAALAWAKRHPARGAPAMDAPEVIEEVFGILASPLAAPLLAELSWRESMSYQELTAVLPAETHRLLHHRLAVLVQRGLVTRIGTRRTYRWSISTAGNEMASVFVALSAWAEERLHAGQATGEQADEPAVPADEPVVLRAEAAVGEAVQDALFAAMGERMDTAGLRSATLRLEFSDAPGRQAAPVLAAA